MGVKNLIKFIEKYAPDAISYKKIDQYKNQRIGFDANLLLYKIIYGIRVQGYDIRNNDMIVTHVHGILLKFMGFLKYSITPIFVFDTKMPRIKLNTLKKRKEVKDKMIEKYKKSKSKEGKRIYYYARTDITQTEIDDFINLILMFGFNLVYAKEESDGQLVGLLENNVIDYIASDDMDILLFGGKRLLKKFTVDSKKYIQQIDLNKVLSSTGMCLDQLIEVGLLLGTDYCDNKSISPTKAYNAVIQDTDTDNDNIGDDCRDAYNYFKDPPIHTVQPFNLKYDLQINKEMLKTFLSKMQFKTKYIDKIFDTIDQVK
jgi:flap endonuclease-1